MSAADVVWSWLGSALTSNDPDGAYRALVDAWAAPLDDVEDVVRGTPGWSVAMDPDTVPVLALPWLAQFAGVILDDRLSTSGRRTQVKERPSARFGTPAAIKAAARPWLTYGDITLNERYTDDPWQVEIVYETDQVDSTLTYDDLAAAYPTYDDIEFGRYSYWDGSEDELQTAVTAAVPADIVPTFTKNP